MSNVMPIRPAEGAEEKPCRTRRKRAEPPVNTFVMPDNLSLVCELEAVCAAQEHVLFVGGNDTEMQSGLATASKILSKMVRESLTNQRII